MKSARDRQGLENFRLVELAQEKISFAQEVENIRVLFAATPNRKHACVCYERAPGSLEWTMCKKQTHQNGLFQDDLLQFPPAIIACGPDHIPVRTAKIHTSFREKLLRQMLAGQRVLCNMVLFHCTTCNNRFPTFHPKHKPEFQLDCVKNCCIEVHEDDWQDLPSDETTQHATLHRGRCMKCRKSLEKVANQPFLEVVATFSARNNWDPLFGFDVEFKAKHQKQNRPSDDEDQSWQKPNASYEICGSIAASFFKQ